MSVLFRNPKRISITVSHRVYELLLRYSDIQGRSVSNLAAFLLESALDRGNGQPTAGTAPVAQSAVNRPVNTQAGSQPLPMFRR